MQQSNSRIKKIRVLIKTRMSVAKQDVKAN